MNYRPGELDQRITLQERVTVADGYGGSSFTWVNIATLSNVWAHVRVGSGREVTEYDRVNAEVNYIFVIRNRSDIDSAYRILWDDEPYNITSAMKPKTRSMYMEISAKSGEPQ